ncbi:hypothetical protein BC939DRAFT_24612 [Gamsiella multidivaricata]|uniref:uncharacterized protein n=1 Tax=Gamsiella multidivaricata TaxID=101098 RepID=UPI00221F83C4|nr:uncharacterized protein BC939DRAFT_24612 [Gamsiella multidivaricata]KAI7829374.1 hypothetical protein BC939DRAFT_24612 [Gamsiella multidivaricata]
MYSTQRIMAVPVLFTDCPRTSLRLDRIERVHCCCLLPADKEKIRTVLGLRFASLPFHFLSSSSRYIYNLFYSLVLVIPHRCRRIIPRDIREQGFLFISLSLCDTLIYRSKDRTTENNRILSSPFASTLIPRPALQQHQLQLFEKKETNHERQGSTLVPDPARHSVLRLRARCRVPPAWVKEGENEMYREGKQLGNEYKDNCTLPSPHPTMVTRLDTAECET